MKLFSELLEGLGGLHDCTMTGLDLDVADRRCTINIEDLYFDCEGLPGYPGATPGSVVFIGINRISLDLPPAFETCWIMEFAASELGEFAGKATVQFWPTGKIEIEYATAEIRGLRGALP